MMESKTETIEKERETMKQATETARIIANMMKHHDRENKRLWAALVACIVALLMMGGVMVYGIVNGQKMFNEAMLNALNTVAEIGVTEETTTTTTTQTGEGDNVEFNNVTGDQYNDSATNEDGGE